MTNNKPTIQTIEKELLNLVINDESYNNLNIIKKNLDTLTAELIERDDYKYKNFEEVLGPLRASSLEDQLNNLKENYVEKYEEYQHIIEEKEIINTILPLKDIVHLSKKEIASLYGETRKPNLDNFYHQALNEYIKNLKSNLPKNIQLESAVDFSINNLNHFKSTDPLYNWTDNLDSKNISKELYSGIEYVNNIEKTKQLINNKPLEINEHAKLITQQVIEAYQHKIPSILIMTAVKEYLTIDNSPSDINITKKDFVPQSFPISINDNNPIIGSNTAIPQHNKIANDDILNPHLNDFFAKSDFTLMSNEAPFVNSGLTPYPKTYVGSHVKMEQDGILAALMLAGLVVTGVAMVGVKLVSMVKEGINNKNPNLNFANNYDMYNLNAKELLQKQESEGFPTYYKELESYFLLNKSENTPFVDNKIEESGFSISINKALDKIFTKRNNDKINDNSNTLKT